jgi:FKBP-type peptidyl-prolyl cis-trans isomerase FkpA
MKYSTLLILAILFISCANDDDASTLPKDYTAENEQEILEYIADNGLVAEKSATGLYYAIDELGTGEQPILTSDVTITYRGYFTDDSEFDISTDNISFNLEQLITGFAESVTYLKEGGNGTFLIPSSLAYGNSGSGFAIPPGAVLIFDISLVSVD